MQSRRRSPVSVLEFVKYTLSPWITRWEQTIHRSLLLPSEKPRYFARFNVEGLLRGDYQSRMNGYAVGRQNGWMSANDIRELENLDRMASHFYEYRDASDRSAYLTMMNAFHALLYPYRRIEDMF